MTIPLILISIGAIFSGWLGIPESLGGGANFQKFLEQVVYHHEVEITDHTLEYGLMVLSVVAGLIGILLAYLIYVKNPRLETLLSSNFKRLYKFLYNKWYFDELYHYVFVVPTFFLARTFVNLIVDTFVIDQTVDGSAKATTSFGSLLQRIHKGIINYYLWGIMLGLIIYFVVYYYLS